MPMRSFLSPGEINYRRHRGRHITRAFEVGVNPDLLHLVKHTGKKKSTLALPYLSAAMLRCE